MPPHGFSFFNCPAIETKKGYIGKIVQGFALVDPLAEQFAHVSPLNYAENRVPNGIDLHGLQFVNKDDAKMYIHDGDASLKRENLSAPTNFGL